MTRSVLFVCTANICRSPFMELVAGSLAAPLAGGVRFGSAGTHGLDGTPMDPVMAAELEDRGLDPSGFRSRRLTPGLVAEADLVLTAGRSHRRFVLEEQPLAFRHTFTLAHFAELVAAAGPHADPLAELAGRGGAAGRQHDVSDPYRRGRAATAACATRLADLLAVVVPALATRPHAE